MSIMGTAVSGLLAYQRALATTSHNISNASTEGYSRQRVQLQTQNPHMLGGMFIGQGVQVSTIERIQSNLVDAQLRTNLSNSASAAVRAGFAENVDNFLADDSTGLAPVLENYFNAIQDVASDPTSLPARIVMLNAAENLTERFGQLNGLFEEQRGLVNGQIKTTVNEINQYSKSLAELNNRIVSDYSAGSAPNDVLDARDNILNKLAEKIDVRTVEQDDGSLSVFIGNGQTLVMGGTASELVTDNLSLDPKNVQIGLKTGSGKTAVDITRFMSGGEIGGLLETRGEMLDGPQKQLGLIALNLATEFNDQNRLGLDLNGELGQDLFTLPEIVPNKEPSNDEASGSPAVSISNVSELTASDYRLSFSGGYQMSRIPSNESVDLEDLGGGIYEADGMRIDISAMSATAGDSWTIQPTRLAASGIGVAASDPEKIAAAGAVYAEPSELNQSEGRILSVRAVDADPAEFPNLMTRAIVERNTASASGYRVDGVDLDPDSVETNDGITTIRANGWELKIQGDIETGDEFVVDSNAGNKGDNRNMLALAGIQNMPTVDDKTTIQDAYSGILADVGSQTRQAQIARDSSATLLEAAQAQREAISGVNLDEEAANLLRFQQAYQASAKVISVAGEMFDTLINAVR